VRLLNEAIAGNANSLAMYFHLLRNRLIGHAKLSSIDEAKSEDAVQEAFIVIFNKMAEGDWGERDFKSPFQLARFIGAVIRNRAFNIGKLACNRHETSLDDGLEEIDPDKQEHHISTKNIRPDFDLELAVDPQVQLETFDALLFLEEVDKYAEQHNTESLSILRKFMIAHLGSDGECVERDFSKTLGITPSQLSVYLMTARVQLENAGLGKREMIEGTFPSSTSTVRLASSYQYEQFQCQL
jgi:DNA-directed RNA polymerase specialized sigma24 family protein